MKASDIIASVGVIILLIAFLLNMYKKISAQGRIYTAMNFLGAGICCFSSYLIDFYPFVVLEGVWGAFALYSFLNVPRGTSK
ncbi:hypothetical protein ACFQZI_16400 [Mucilaginibacter lutimaris]|uniref:CBU-0592-like domain-containing protein n=1 Tax=Mucilaginibacter lutimaris TaxID=931629 RepID=A0ABW2ZJX1_9SPHI